MSRRAIERIKRVQGEFDATRFALNLTVQQSAVDPLLLRGHAGLAVADLRRSAENAEATYVVRMFAEFEATLRDYWANLKKKSTPRVRGLIDGIASQCRVAGQLLAEVHEVRLYRNAIVHQGEAIQSVPFPSCRSVLCRFLANLPAEF